MSGGLFNSVYSVVSAAFVRIPLLCSAAAPAATSSSREVVCVTRPIVCARYPTTVASVESPPAPFSGVAALLPTVAVLAAPGTGGTALRVDFFEGLDGDGGGGADEGEGCDGLHGCGWAER